MSGLKLGIDSRTLNVKGGTSVYVENLLKNLDEINDIEVVLYGPKKKSNDMRNHNPLPKNENLRPIWENVSILPYINKEDLDIFHGPKNILPPVRNCKGIVTIHDTKFEYLSDSVLTKLYLESFIPFSINRAEKVITISKSSKKDIINKYSGLENEDVEVIYQGYNEKLFKKSNAEKNRKFLKEAYPSKSSSLNKFILNVSTLGKNKNQGKIIEAIAERDLDISFFILGRDAGQKKVLKQKVSKLDLERQVHFMGYVQKEHLPKFYNAAELFVFPSLHEGFGIPPLEAMACGTPVITSDRTSLPEVVGDAGIIVDPEDTSQLSYNIEKFLNNETLQEKMIKKGLRRAEVFSWKKTAEQTVELYRDILK